MHKLIIAIPLLALAGCNVHVEPGTSDPAKFSVETHQKSEQVEVTKDIPPGAVRMRDISVTSCMKFQWDPEPTNETALVLLRAKAKDQGAKGIAGVRYSRSNISLTQNCYSNITATGTAYQ